MTLAQASAHVLMVEQCSIKCTAYKLDMSYIKQT